MNTGTSTDRSPLLFFLLVFGLSIPLSLAGGLIGLELVPGVPISAVVVAFCPMIAALILIYWKERAAGAIAFLKRAFDFGRIQAKAWYIPTVLLMPVVMLLEYGLLRLTGSPIPAPRFSIWTPLSMFIMYFVEGIGEELGWMGYAI